jgi:hypothetical protein
MVLNLPQIDNLFQNSKDLGDGLSLNEVGYHAPTIFAGNAYLQMLFGDTYDFCVNGVTTSLLSFPSVETPAARDGKIRNFRTNLRINNCDGDTRILIARNRTTEECIITYAAGETGIKFSKQEVDFSQDMLMSIQIDTTASTAGSVIGIRYTMEFY